MRQSMRFAVVLLAVSSLARAEEAKTATASVAGQWEMTRETPMGTMTTVFDLQQEGENVTGTMKMSGGRGTRETPVTGTVKGSALKLSATMTGRDGETRTMEYTGTVGADELKLEFVTPRGDKREATAKRAAAKTEAPAAAPEAKP